MKIGLLGCYGFIGANILKRLVDSNHDVVGIDRYVSVPQTRRNLIPAGFTAISADIIDTTSFVKHLRNVEVIIFAAGNPAPASSSFDLLFGEELRVIVQLLEFISHDNPTSKLIFISSGGTVYGPRNMNDYCFEDEKVHPISLYGVMKTSCEAAIEAYVYQYGLKSIILRVANPYGVGQDPNANQGLIPVVLKKLMLKEEIKVWGKGDTYRDYLFIDDFCDLVEIMITKDTVDCIYNVGSGKAVSTIEIINVAAEITKTKPLIKFEAMRPQDIRWNALSIEKAHTMLHWTPKTSLETGISKVYSWIKSLNIKGD